MGAGSVRGASAAPAPGLRSLMVDVRFLMCDARSPGLSESEIKNQESNIIQAVLFDLGDTILSFGRVRTTKVFLEGAKASYAFLRQHGQYGGGFAWYFLRNLVRLHVRYVLSDILQRDFNSLELLRTVGERKGVRLSPEQWEQFAWLWYEPLARCARIEPDLPETLAALQRMGLKLGIVSNTFVSRASLERQLRELGLLDFFCMQLYSCEFHFRKPDVKIFRIAAERIGTAEPQILFVGDRIDNDIRPALQSGMKAALKDAHTNAGKPTPPGAHRIHRLAELPGLVEKINGAGVPSGSVPV
jgi:HAD superfamily hydrolase (TIGR01549 family)